jgi:hypothetical protein
MQNFIPVRIFEREKLCEMSARHCEQAALLRAEFSQDKAHREAQAKV